MKELLAELGSETTEDPNLSSHLLIGMQSHRWSLLYLVPLVPVVGSIRRGALLKGAR